MYSRGHLSLIVGQPLHPIKPQPTNGKPAQLMKPALVSNVAPRQRPIQHQPQQVLNANPVHRTNLQFSNPHQVQLKFNAQPYPQTHRVNEVPTTSATRPASSSFPMQTSGPPKRPVSHTETEPVKKKAKGSDEMKCPVCEMSPHLLKDCPAVLEGSKRFGDTSK